jgi:hypothetical protein
MQAIFAFVDFHELSVACVYFGDRPDPRRSQLWRQAAGLAGRVAMTAIVPPKRRGEAGGEQG